MAAVFEVAFALSMKASKGFTVFWPSVLTVAGVIGGIAFLSLALRSLPVSIGYPIWVGLGALGTVLFSYAVFGEHLTALKIASVAAIVIGVAGLKVAGSAPDIAPLPETQ